MSAPEISIIMPTYNRAYRISKTIASLVAQPFHKWELLIIDDGSKDNTTQEIRKFANDPRVKYYRKENGGAASARNFGLTKVSSSLVGYVDSDDPVGLDFLSVAFAHFQQNQHCTFTICNHEKAIELYDKSQTLIAELPRTPAATTDVTLADLYQWKFKTSGTGIFHRWPIASHIHWNEDLKLLEDLEFLLQLGVEYPRGFKFISEVLFTYAQCYGGDGACSNANYLDFSKAFQQIYELHKDDPLMVAETYTKRVDIHAEPTGPFAA